MERTSKSEESMTDLDDNVTRIASHNAEKRLGKLNTKLDEVEPS